jgi:hypothetical protein
VPSKIRRHAVALLFNQQYCSPRPTIIKKKQYSSCQICDLCKNGRDFHVPETMVQKMGKFNREYLYGYVSNHRRISKRVAPHRK